MIRVYLAASVQAVEHAAHIEKLLAVAGLGSTSTWIAKMASLYPDDRCDPPREWERQELLVENKADILRADAVVVLASRGTPRATYGDAVYGLAMQKPTVWTHSERGHGRCLWDSDPLVRRLIDDGRDDELARQIEGLVRRMVGTVAA